MNHSPFGFKVIKPGMLSQIQDAGRFGKNRIGLTTGGPLDPQTFNIANALLNNSATESTSIEITMGGLVLESGIDTFISICGAPMPLKINGKTKALWCIHPVKVGDIIEVAFTSRGLRAYLAVKDGFQVTPQFGSAATVVRENIGGLNGAALGTGDTLSCSSSKECLLHKLPDNQIPTYNRHVLLRTIPCYQHNFFSREQKQRFFSSYYRVSDKIDRMGYRFEGNKIESSLSGILSEGISLGAIQVPADGQPIVLLQDRQTIGGYPKLGTVISSDLAKLSQLTPGCTVNFRPVTVETAQRINTEENQKHIDLEFEQLNSV
ncbi:MAG: biotin-dependent carboxyltransferase family protein [Cellvibrionaceae bacterium]